MMAWAVSTLDILRAMESELDPSQMRLAVRVIEHWGKVIPLILADERIPRLIMGEETESIRSLFADADAIAGVVRIARPALPHAAENVERDERIIAELRAFCEEKLAAIRGFSGNGFEVEGWVFDHLTVHLRNLLYVVLGDRHIATFIAKYDAAMEEMRTQVQLLDAPVH